MLLCEHASNFIPASYNGLGLSHADQQRHIAWDPGAAATALYLSHLLDAPLVCATLSRLLLDLNRPLDAADSIVAHSEDTAIPGNVGLDPSERRARQVAIYEPFHARVDELLAWRRSAGLPTAVVSIHSFTPRYLGVQRPWQIGVLSQHDRRLADALLRIFAEDRELQVGDNQPYAPKDRVYHSVGRHGEMQGLLCAMLELRNDLISSTQQQLHWAARLQQALLRALDELTSP